MRKLGGVLISRLKNSTESAPEAIPVPPEVKLPMSMHFGTPAKLLVKAGDYVKVGQMIGEAAEMVSSPVYASVSGTVKNIDYIDSFTGEEAVTVTITSDGRQIPWEGIKPPPQIMNWAGILEAVKNSGVVESDGAGYPTAHELMLENYNKLDYILVNGLEDEPYITSNARAMTDDAESVWEGAKLLKMYLNPRKLIICMDNRQRQAVSKMTALSADAAGIEVRALPPLYPQGQRKVLAYNVTGRIVPEGERLPDIGCIVINCATVAAIAAYVKTGTPLVSKCVTVGGPAVKSPKNLIAPIGTPVSALFDYCGGLKDDVKKIVLGGPISGTAIPNVDIPIVKTTNAVLAFSEKNAAPSDSRACIKCGQCVNVCPMRLLLPYIENAYELKKYELLRKFKVNICAECRCCAYSCPAKRPLAQVMALSKNILKRMSEGEAKE